MGTGMGLPAGMSGPWMGMGMDARRLQGTALVGIPTRAGVPQTPLETPHGAAGLAGTCPFQALHYPAAHPSPGLIFPEVPPSHPIHDISLHPTCCVLFWAQGGPDPLTRLILRDGPGQWNVPCAPKLWLPTYIPQDQTISLDLSDEVTPKLPGSNLSELLTHHSITS